MGSIKSQESFKAEEENRKVNTRCDNMRTAAKNPQPESNHKEASKAPKLGNKIMACTLQNCSRSRKIKTEKPLQTKEK